MRAGESKTSGLAQAAEQRSEWARGRVHNAISRLERDGKPITFQSVAREAGVSRQFLYAVDALRGEIERLRGADRERDGQVPASQRASEASLKARNQMLLEENRRLREELAGLREELAGAWGELRALEREHRRTAPNKAAS
jgi:Family of unknown function (DUF6262)